MDSLRFSFDFCEPGEDANHPKEGVKVSENLGQILLGERIRTSPFKVSPGFPFFKLSTARHATG